jgi:hypothetical protein
MSAYKIFQKSSYVLVWVLATLFIATLLPMVIIEIFMALDVMCYLLFAVQHPIIPIAGPIIIGSFILGWIITGQIITRKQFDKMLRWAVFLD